MDTKVGCVFPYREVNLDTMGNFSPRCQFVDDGQKFRELNDKRE